MACIEGHGGGIGALQGGTIWWVTSNYKTANRVIWPNLKRALAGAWVQKSEIDHSMTLPDGGSVTVLSADNPDSLRGDGLDGLVLDEAAFQSEYLWTDVLRPALADKQGWAIFISTPNGYNWFHDLYQRGGKKPGWESWKRPTSDNPLIMADELEAAYIEGPRTFQQEYCAEFMEARGVEWPAEWFPDSDWVNEWPKREDITLRVMAVDSSMGRQGDAGDYSAIVSLVRTKDHLLYVEADMDRRPYPKVIRDGIAFAKRFERETFGPLDGFGVEADVFQELIADEFRRQTREAQYALPVYNVLTGAVPKTVRIRRLSPYLGGNNFRWLNTKSTQLLHRQMREFPMGEFDDGPDALEMALRLGVELFNGRQG